MVPTTRRHLLAGAASAGSIAVAGCLQFGTGCTRSLTLRLEPTTDADIVERNADPPAELHPVGRSLVERAREDGAATFRSHADPPVPGTGYVELDGRYVRVVTEVTGNTTVTGYTFDVTMDEESTAGGSPGDTVAFEDLPAHDQQGFLAGLDFPPVGKIDGTKSMSGSATIAYAEQSLVESSVLIPDPEYGYVEYRGHPFRLAKTGTEQVTVLTHEVRLEQVADSPAALAELVRDEHGVVLRSDDLSAEQRDVLETAIEDGHDECAEYSTATRGLVDRLREADYARYEGTWYHVDMYEAVE